jgi:hypothetical protein
MGEFVMVVSQWTLPESSPVALIIRSITGPYIAAQLFQTLWTASFRPKYNNGIYKYVSAMNLSGVAYALSFCHDAYIKSGDYSSGEYWLYFLPLSLHFGWTTAAALVNWNGMFALGDDADVSSKAVAWLGHLSVIGATVVGVYVSLERSAPVYSGVIAWALTAVASGLGKRLKETEKEEDSYRVGVYGARTQRALSLLGAMTCAAASIAACLADE